MPNLGLMAWSAVTSLDPDEVEALELSCRHEVDLSLVLGLAPADVGALLDRARQSLERALAAEIVIKKSRACAFRAELLTGWTGVTSPDVRDRMLEHAFTCPVCEPHLPHHVSPARVFAQLPAPELSSLARLEILEFFRDPRISAYREFAASRAAEATGFAFLLPTGRVPAPQPSPEQPPADPSGAQLPGAQSSGPQSSGADPEPGSGQAHRLPPRAGPVSLPPGPDRGRPAGQVPPRRGPGLHRFLGPGGFRARPSCPAPRRPGPRCVPAPGRPRPPPGAPATPPRTGPTARSPKPGPTAPAPPGRKASPARSLSRPGRPSVPCPLPRPPSLKASST